MDILKEYRDEIIRIQSLNMLSDIKSLKRINLDCAVRDKIAKRAIYDYDNVTPEVALSYLKLNLDLPVEVKTILILIARGKATGNSHFPNYLKIQTKGGQHEDSNTIYRRNTTNDTLLFTSRDAAIKAEKILADERIVKRSQRYQETNEY